MFLVWETHLDLFNLSLRSLRYLIVQQPYVPWRHEVTELKKPLNFSYRIW